MSAAQRTLVAGSDLVISTGALSYLGATTVAKVLTAAVGRTPWLLCYAARVVAFAPIAARLGELGYGPVEVGDPVRQWRFASAAEQACVITTVTRL